MDDALTKGDWSQEAKERSMGLVRTQSSTEHSRVPPGLENTLEQSVEILSEESEVGALEYPTVCGSLLLFNFLFLLPTYAHQRQ
ncbi:hypothetical protein CBR_g54206 [Chara braunii]|uniref:Uncharacterized protein n=1 Tax=Chara braunii TaxID=69332 RepID=A0A388K7I5_CHABU|nr:hypothetical protein CBR_g54206 [Chara braunii]|eukprot:GBG65913.1 hypothetical protein CBR_g54206 [Chara braunii]